MGVYNSNSHNQTLEEIQDLCDRAQTAINTKEYNIAYLLLSDIIILCDDNKS